MHCSYGTLTTCKFFTIIFKCSGNPWECRYTDVWLDGWISQIDSSCVAGVAYLTCKAADPPRSIRVAYEKQISSEIPVKQLCALTVLPTVKIPYLTKYELRNLSLLFNKIVGSVFLFLIVICFLSCKRGILLFNQSYL